MSCLHLLSYDDSLTHLTQTYFVLNAQLFLKPKLLLHKEHSTTAAMAKNVTHPKRFQLCVAQHLSNGPT
jgi:hypothetical protein